VCIPAGEQNALEKRRPLHAQVPVRFQKLQGGGRLHRPSAFDQFTTTTMGEDAALERPEPAPVEHVHEIALELVAVAVRVVVHPGDKAARRLSGVAAGRLARLDPAAEERPSTNMPKLPLESSSSSAFS